MQGYSLLSINCAGSAEPEACWTQSETSARGAAWLISTLAAWGSAVLCAQHAGVRGAQDHPLLRSVDWPSGNLASSSDEPPQMITHTPGHLLPGHFTPSRLHAAVASTDPLTVTPSMWSTVICGWQLLKDEGYVLFTVIPPVLAQCSGQMVSEYRKR